MAKKRLNKKVALIGSVVFVIVAIAAILVILRLSRDPEKFIKDGDAAVKAARAATDEDAKQQEYERAERNYHNAHSYAKTDSLKIEVLFKLVDVYLETDQWRNVIGCWNRIIRIDQKNVKARFGRLKYLYIMADSGVRGVWQEVASQASELIEVAEEADLLAEDTAKWESFGVQEKQAASERMGPYLYLLRGRAFLQITMMGAVTDRDELLARAIDDLEKVRELEPGNVDAYWYLAQAFVEKGKILAERGNLEEKDKAAERAEQLLAQAIEVTGADPRAHINLLTMKLQIMIDRRSSREQIQSLEPECLSLVEKFPSSARAFSALAWFYGLSFKNLDKAVEAAEKAVELDKENVVYAINAANLYYRKFSIYGQKPEVYKAIEMAKNALALPDAQDKPGPRQWASRMSRIALCAFLAKCYIEQIIEPCEARTEAQKQEWLTDAEQAVHEIEQLFGIGEAPQVIKWRGMLELAKGNRNSAVRKMYTAYEQFKSIDQKDPLLSYWLAKVFENTTELGAAREFFISALSDPGRIHERKPEVILDYADVLLKLRGYGGALSVVNFFENNYWANERSRRTRMNAYIGAGQFGEVEEELARREPDDANTIKLKLALVRAKMRRVQSAISQRQIKESSPIIFQGLETPERDEGSVRLMTAELKGYWTVCAGLVEKLLQMEPNSVGEGLIADICNNYIAEGQASEAETIVNRFLEHFPDNTTALFYKQMLSEPEPGKISQQRRKEIEEQVRSNIADPITKAMSLGVFYQGYNELEKVAVEFKEGLKSERAEEHKGTYDLCTSALKVALVTKDLELAEQIADVGRQANLDGCEGEFFAAIPAMVKEEYKDALARFNECLKQRPVFSHGFMLRSNVNAALGDEHASIEDARRAASLNPLDGTIAKGLAFVLFWRNQKLGDNVSSDQIIETRDALVRALRVNPDDSQLLSLYAEFISSTEPSRALAIRQHLQRVVPSVQNALLLGRMAMKMALDEVNAEGKEALFAIAASSFEQARALEPQNKAVLDAQAEFFRLRGQPEKAEELLAQSQDQKLLWSHYFRTGRFEEAKQVLEQLYQTRAEDSNAVKGLLLVAERTADKEAAKKYSEELLLLEDRVENHLFQIQTFLKLGLVKEAEYKLQSFKEKYPDEPSGLLLEAWLAMKQGRLKDALELTNRSLESNQDNAIAWRLRGGINLLMADYTQAIIDLKNSKSLLDEPVTRISLAKAYLRAGRKEDAITELKNTIDRPQAPMEGRELLEQIYLQLGRKAALKRFYDETLEKFPDSVFWYNRAGAFAIAEGQFDRAAQLYRQAWQKGKKDGKADAASLDGYLQALVLGAGTPNAIKGVWDPGKLDRVFEEGRKYVDGDFAPIAYLRMAEAKMKLGDKATAIQYCQRTLAKAFAGTDEIFASEILQRVHSLLGAEEVLKYCKQRLKTDPDSLAANLAMFNMTKINGEYNKAVGYIDKCLQIAGPDSPRRVAYIMGKTRVLQLAYNKTSDNNYLERAVAEYESLLAEMPNNTIALNNLAYMLAENNERLAEALKYTERAYQIRPNNPGLLDTYAYVLYKNGRNSEADEFLQAALQQYESRQIGIPAEVYEHLGMIKEELGAEAEALTAYKQALEMGADELSKAARERITAAIERLSRQAETKK